jgi:hypothetical protein
MRTSAEIPNSDYQLSPDNPPFFEEKYSAGVDFYDALEVPDDSPVQPRDIIQHAMIDIPEHKAPPEEKQIIYIKQETLARLRLISKCLAGFTAFYDASGIIMSLNDMEEMSDDTLTKALGLSINHLFYAVPIFYATPLFDINYPSIVDGLKMAMSFYYSNQPLKFKSPCCGHDGLDCCDRFRSIIAISVILSIALFASAADGLDGDYFVLQVMSDPNLLWKIFSAICSVLVALTTLLTETPELFSYFCSNMDEALLPVLVEGEVYEEPVAEAKVELSARVQAVDTFIGNYLRIFGGIELAIEVYVALVALMNPQTAEAKYILFSISFLRSSTNFFFYGKKGLETVDALFLNLAGGGPTLKQLFVFLLSITPVLLVTDCLRELYRKFLTDPTTELPFYCPSYLVELIAVHTAVFEGVVLMGATGDLLTKGINYIQNGLYGFYEKCCGANVAHEDAIQIEVENDHPFSEVEYKDEPRNPLYIELSSSAKKHNRGSNQKAILIELGTSSVKKNRPIEDEYIETNDLEQPLMAHEYAEAKLEALDDEAAEIDPSSYVPPAYHSAGHRNAFFNPAPPVITPPRSPQPQCAQKKSSCAIM